MSNYMSNLVIDGNEIKSGERKRICLSIAKLYDFTEVNIPIEVIRGKEELNNGDTVAHIATFKDTEKVEENINIFKSQIDDIESHKLNI